MHSKPKAATATAPKVTNEKQPKKKKKGDDIEVKPEDSSLLDLDDCKTL